MLGFSPLPPHLPPHLPRRAPVSLPSARHWRPPGRRKARDLARNARFREDPRGPSSERAGKPPGLKHSRNWANPPKTSPPTPPPKETPKRGRHLGPAKSRPLKTRGKLESVFSFRGNPPILGFQLPTSLFWGGGGIQSRDPYIIHLNTPPCKRWLPFIQRWKKPCFRGNPPIVGFQIPTLGGGGGELDISLWGPTPHSSRW